MLSNELSEVEIGIKISSGSILCFCFKTERGDSGIFVAIIGTASDTFYVFHVKSGLMDLASF